MVSLQQAIDSAAELENWKTWGDPNPESIRKKENSARFIFIISVQKWDHLTELLHFKLFSVKRKWNEKKDKQKQLKRL